MLAMSAEGLAAARETMCAAGVHPIAIDVFAYYYEQLESGATGLMYEADLDPLPDPPRLADLEFSDEEQRRALATTAVVKLNGGLGTSMGMERAKSLLEVRDGLSFLDIIVRQVQHVREASGVRLPLVFMHSFRTRDETLAVLESYDGLAVEGVDLDFLQNREPKLRADDLTPVSWPADPSLAWCPPGHGDLYTALTASGVLQQLLDAGFRAIFVSNADNLGAVPDAQMAAWFADSGAPFASEVSRRTPADRKGGHLAVRRSDGQLVLRETAQTAPEDADAMSDINRHRFVNTNNLWMDLHAIAETMDRTGGVLGLPLIRNDKTVDPGDSSSPKVIQVETAMGAAVEVFDGARAIEVTRARFLPVKSTNDLLAMRSDAFEFGPGHTVRLVEGLSDAPYVELDSAYYKLIGAFDAHFPQGAPSLAQASSFTVRGDWTFGADVVVCGDVTVDAEGSPGTIETGTELGRRD